MFRKISIILTMALALSINASAFSARSYALIEASTGRMLEGQNTTLRLPMASTTKIMTGLLACESGRLDDVITIPGDAIIIEGSSMGLVSGEKLTLRELTYGLLLQSGNDAANVIAVILAGSIPQFADLMNSKAQELHLSNTHFMNPSGLDHEAHYTTSLDLARLGAYAMKNPVFKQIVSTYKMRIPYNGVKDGRLLVNHNELLNMFDGTIGIKTGYTKRSGRCLVSCAERNGVTIVAATLNGHDDWGDHIALLTQGFSKLKRYPLLTEMPILNASVISGTADSVRCRYNNDLTAILTKDELLLVRTEYRMRPFYYAPVIHGDKLGEIVFSLDGIELAKTDIIADETITRQVPNHSHQFWRGMF